MANGDGWCPFARRLVSPNRKNGRNGQRVKAVVMHIAQGGEGGSIDWLTNPASGASSHFFIAKSGRLTQLVNINDTASGNGLTWNEDHWLSPQESRIESNRPGLWSGLEPPIDPNRTTVSVEHAGFTGELWTAAMDDMNTRLLIWLAEQYQLVYEPRTTLIGHFEISPIDREFCPGSTVDYGRIAAAANARVFPGSVSGLTFRHPARISPGQFAEVLQRANSPAAIAAAELYHVPVRVGIDPAIALAFFGHESSYGAAGRAVQNLSWGNVRAPYNQLLATGVDNAGFATYASWRNSLQDWCLRIMNRYVLQGLDTVEKAVPVYAPSSDNNDEQAYVDAVYARINRWQPPRFWRVTVNDTKVREGPDRSFSVARGDSEVMQQGQTAAFDGFVPGENIGGNLWWGHRADDVGFVHSSLLEPVV